MSRRGVNSRWALRSMKPVQRYDDGWLEAVVMQGGGVGGGCLYATLHAQRVVSMSSTSANITEVDDPSFLPLSVVARSKRHLTAPSFLPLAVVAILEAPHCTLLSSTNIQRLDKQRNINSILFQFFCNCALLQVVPFRTCRGQGPACMGARTTTRSGPVRCGLSRLRWPRAAVSRLLRPRPCVLLVLQQRSSLQRGGWRTKRKGKSMLSWDCPCDSWPQRRSDCTKPVSRITE